MLYVFVAVYMGALTAENIARKEEKKLPTLTDLLPKELEPISPESDTLKEKDDSDEEGEIGFADGKEEEESSPPFEPIEEVNSRLEESSIDSHLSGISELTSHESQHSHVSFMVSNHANNNSSLTKMPALDLSNNDSQLSKVSSGSRLSIVSLYEQDYRLPHNIEINDDSQQSRASLPVSVQDTQTSMNIEYADEESEVKDRDSHVTRDTYCEESSIHDSKLQISTQNSSDSISDGLTTTSEKPKIPQRDQEESSQGERSDMIIDNVFENTCEATPKKTLIEEYEHKNEVFGYKSIENETKRMVNKLGSKHDVSNNKISNDKFEEKCEEKVDEKSDELKEEKSDKIAEIQCEFKVDEAPAKKESEKFDRFPDEKSERKVEEKCMRQDESLEKKLGDKCERIVEEGSEIKSEEKSERKLDDKFNRNLYEKSARRVDEKHEKKTNDKLERKLVEKPEKNYDEKSEVRYDEKCERKSDDIYERKSDEKSERKYDEKSEHKLDDKHERKSEEKSERKPDEKSERKLDVKYERKSDEKSECKLDDKYERKSDEKSERKLDVKYERKSDEKSECKLYDKYERKSDEKSERKPDEKSERKLDVKYERKSDEKSECKLDDKYERKTDEKSERKYSDSLECNVDEGAERKSDEICQKKSDEKIVRKLDERSARKIHDKSEKKLVDKSEKKLDIKLEKKTDDKSDRKSDTRCEKKVDDKHDKKQDKHRDDRDKYKEKKDEKRSSESKDIKKNESSGRSSEVDRKRSDKGKHKKERGDSRIRAEKVSKDGKEKTEKGGVKVKIHHEEKTERDTTKEKSKQDVKENKVEKSDEKEKKVQKDSSKEKCKKEDDVLRHEKDSKKSKNDEKRERDVKEKPKSEEKIQMKHNDKHKERTKPESRDKSDKDKSARHDDKNSRDGSRSSSKGSKDRVKQEFKDKGKGTANKSEEKKSKDKSKHEERTSKDAGKGSMKKKNKKEETELTKSSHTDHKSKNSGKKGKENKGKNVTDDHRIHRDKRSDDRRSTDRDSNGTAQSRSVGSTTSRTNGNDSQRTQSHRDKSGSSSNSNKSDSGGNSESSSVESSKNVEENIPSTSKTSSPPSSLPFKKRPLSIQSEDECGGGNGELYRSKIKKPKIAANIFEVKKIMMLRKSLAKKERKQQKELKKNRSTNEEVKEMRSEKKMSKPVVAKRRKLGDVEKSLRKEVDVSLSNKQMPEVESDKGVAIPGLKYFDSELSSTALSHAESEFLAYVRHVENDNLSEISLSSYPESETSDVDDIIQLPSSCLDDIVAAELGAKIIKTDKGMEIVFDLPEDEKPSKRDLPSLHSTVRDSLHVTKKGFTATDPFSVTASPGQAVVINPCDSNLRHSAGERVDLRSISVRSSSSDTSADNIILNERNVKRILKRGHSTSIESRNSNKNTSEVIGVASNGLDTGRIPDSSSKIQKKIVFSRKKVKKGIAIPEMKPPDVALENRDLQRSQKPNTRYSDKMYASHLDDDDLSHDAFSEERDKIILNDECAIVTHNDVSKNAPGRATSMSPVSLGGNKVCFARVKIPATITQADDDSSERENASEPSFKDRYDIINDNNNIDKGSSEDERGCADGSMLNQDLILPTLRDLMVESGFRIEDDKPDILPSSVGIENSVGNSLLVTGSSIHNDKRTVRDAHENSVRKETKQQNLGRSRRVGLGRPHPKRSSEQAGDDDTRHRMPPSSNVADFVMPLSPESDVSASSGEAKKSVLDSKGKL
jgi:hypothetical protein